MFQFPGFAFVSLCIQVTNTWLTSLLITPKGNNNKVSGGLPHSEIHGSKLILSSPWLIAEYHVLHRLLLPRHPPNALFALDLIQKKHCFLYGRPPLLYDLEPTLTKSHTFPMPAAGSRQASFLVSVLDLETKLLGVEPQVIPHSGDHNSDVILSIRCQFSSSWTAKCPKTLNGQTVCWWSVSGSNR